MMRYLDRQEIIEINRRMTLEFGGLFSQHCDNIQNANSFEYLLQAPKLTAHVKEIYPSVFLKAAVYCYIIIKDHIFYDGNKRTGVESSFLFLEINGYSPKADLSPDKIINLALSVEKGDMNIEKIALFFEEYFDKQ